MCHLKSWGMEIKTPHVCWGGLLTRSQSCFGATCKSICVLSVFYTQIMVITYPTTRGREINEATRSQFDFLMTQITRTFAKRILFFCFTGGRKLLAPLYFVSWPRPLLCANSSIPTLTAEWVLFLNPKYSRNYFSWFFQFGFAMSNINKLITNEITKSRA